MAGPGPGDPAGTPPTSPGSLPYCAVVITPANELIPSPPDWMGVNLSYNSNVVGLRSAIQSQLSDFYNDSSMQFVWLDDKGIL